MKKKLLLHICCAPCSTIPIKRLSDEYEITGYFYNPNIYPEEEYLRRLEEAKRYFKKNKIELIIEKYNPDDFYNKTKGFENEPEKGSRCYLCFELRLEKLKKYTEDNNFKFICTSLTISPHKNHLQVNKAGKNVTLGTDIIFLEENFKKKDGYKESLIISKKECFYRQNYCGCKWSII